MKTNKRWVIKLGTGILTKKDGTLDGAQFNQLIAQVAALNKKGFEVVLVTSGAIGAGMEAMCHDKRPSDLVELQACATVGQIRLMAEYQKRLLKHGLHGAQLLLTYWDLDSRSCFDNARRTLQHLLERKSFIPIINENDAISGEEIKVGDNDRLSAHVAVMVEADCLVILSNVEGLLNSPDATGKLIPMVRSLDPKIWALAKGTSSQRSVGGMTTKLLAAKIAAEEEIPTVIANGRDPTVLVELASGKKRGTRFILS